MRKLILDVVKIIWGNGPSKAGSALAILGATAFLGWIDQLIGRLLGIEIRQPPTWGCLLVMFIGIGLLIWGNWKPTETTAPNLHDVALMRSFRQLITEPVLEFLRNHNFGTPWRRSRLDALGEFAETWRGARYEFQDPDLNAALVRAKGSADNLEELIAVGSWPERNNAEIQTVKTEEDYRMGTQQATVNKVREMNDSASALVRDIDALECLARRKQI